MGKVPLAARQGVNNYVGGVIQLSVFIGACFALYLIFFKWFAVVAPEVRDAVHLSKLGSEVYKSDLQDHLTLFPSL